jgi:ribosomal protein L32
MAVPKKRTSYSKKNSRFASWYNKTNKKAKNAFSLAKIILHENSNIFLNSFISKKIKKIKSLISLF